jgi:maltose alpha-D-glucosyltransferase/alpha-amylase
LLPKNQAALVLLRTHGDETILAVCNLSGEPLAVDLDLAAWAGGQPIDLFSEAPLRRIGSAPYHLDLEGYGYHWLQLGT